MEFRSSRKFVLVFVCLSLFLFLLIAIDHTPIVAAQSSDFFQATTAPPTYARVEKPFVERTRFVHVDVAQLLSGDAQQLVLNFFADQSITATYKRTERSPAIDGFVWIGQRNDAPEQQVLVSVVGDTIFASVTAAGYEILTVKHVADGVHIVRQIDPKSVMYPPIGNDAIAITYDDDDSAMPANATGLLDGFAFI